MTNPIVFLLAFGFLFLVHYIVLKIKNSWDVLDPLNFIFAGAFVIYPLEYSSAAEWYIQRHGSEVVADALSYIIIFLIATQVSYYSFRNKRAARRLPDLGGSISPRSINFLAFSLLAVGAGCWGYLIKESGGLNQWASLPRGNIAWENVSGYLHLGTLLIPVAAVILWYPAFFKKKSWNFFPAIVTILAFLLYAYIGSRSQIIAMTAGIFIAWSLAKRKSINLIAALPVAFALIITTNFLAGYRSHFYNLSFNTDEYDLSQAISRSIPIFGEGKDEVKAQGRAGSELNLTFAVIKRVPSYINHTFGSEYLQFIYQPIPRQIWPGKRYPRNEAWSELHLSERSSSHWITHVEKPFIAGPAPGIVASFYYSAGIFGLFFGAVMTGFVSSVLRSLFDRARYDRNYIPLAFILTPLNFIHTVGHPFAYLTSVPIILIVVVLSARISSLKWSRRKVPPRHPYRLNKTEG